MADLTHFDADGSAHMVDVSGKQPTARTAVAACCVEMRGETLEMIVSGGARKGDVIGVARLAGIMAAKRTADLIPLCHPIALEKVSLELDADPDLPGLRIQARVTTTGKTGVEMEALTAVSVAALTVYDMVKSADRGVRISDIHLSEKDGGKSGRYRA